MNNLTELPRRNAAAVEQALRHMEERLTEGLKFVQQLQQAVNALHVKVVQLESTINFDRATRMGHGPTR